MLSFKCALPSIVSEMSLYKTKKFCVVANIFSNANYTRTATFNLLSVQYTT